MARQSKRFAFSIRAVRDKTTGDVSHFVLRVDGELTDEQLEVLRMKVSAARMASRRSRSGSASQQAFRRGPIERERSLPAKGLTKAEFDRELARLLPADG